MASADNKESWILAVKAIPNASRNEVVGYEADGALKIKLRAVPEDGKANKELLKFLSKKTGLFKSSMRLISGETARHKRLQVEGVQKSQFMDLLGCS